MLFEIIWKVRYSANVTILFIFLSFGIYFYILFYFYFLCPFHPYSLKYYVRVGGWVQFCVFYFLYIFIFSPVICIVYEIYIKKNKKKWRIENTIYHDTRYKMKGINISTIYLCQWETVIRLINFVISPRVTCLIKRTHVFLNNFKYSG